MSIDGTVVLFFEITILSKMLLKFDILLNIMYISISFSRKLLNLFQSVQFSLECYPLALMHISQKICFDRRKSSEMRLPSEQSGSCKIGSLIFEKDLQSFMVITVDD